MDKIVKIKEEHTIKGCVFEVELEYYYDSEEDEYYTDVELGNKNLKIVRNEYRRINNLLTDEEIKSIREKYDLSQKDFAIILGFGEVTITRYESKQIQDRAQDLIIRMAEDPSKFLEQLEQNKAKYIKEYSLEKYNKLKTKILKMFNKNNIDLIVKKQSLLCERVKTVIHRILKSGIYLTKTKLAKLLWYIDFINYKETNKSLTGLNYLCLEFGAYPVDFEKILNDKDIEIKCSFSQNGEHVIKQIVSCKSSGEITEGEIEVIEKVINKFKDYNTEKIVDYMHKEKAYMETNYGDIISYEYAKYINLNEELL